MAISLRTVIFQKRSSDGISAGLGGFVPESQRQYDASSQGRIYGRNILYVTIELFLA